MAVCVPGVLVALSVFLQFFVNVTIMKSLGMMLVAIQEEFSADTWILGSIFAAVDTVSDLLSPIAGPMGRIFGSRPVTMAGGVMAVAGFIIASRATDVQQLALALNVLIAMGYSFANVLTRAELGRHFDKSRFALASGFAQTGAAIALISQPPLVQLFLNTYGWRGTMLLLGSIGAHLVVCGALLIPSPAVSDANSARKYQLLQRTSDEPSQPDKERNKAKKIFTSLWQSVGNIFDLSLMKDYNFWIVTIISVVSRMTIKAWVIYFVPYAVAKGFSNDFAAVMVTIAGVGQLVGSVFISVAVYKEKVTSTSAMMVTIIVLAISLFICPWLNSGWLVSANAAIFLAAHGAVFALNDVLVQEFLGFERMPGAYGWIGFMTGIARFFSGFVPGWIYDHSGSYDLAFIIFGAIQMTTAIPLLIKMVLLKISSKQRY